MYTVKYRQSRGAPSTGSRRPTSSSSSSRPTRYSGTRDNTHPSHSKRDYHSRGNRHSRGQGGQGRGRKMPTFDPSRFINTNPVDTTPEIYKPKNSFETFGLQPALVHTIHSLGLTIPTPIQDQIIPHILDGRDVIGIAETGTGKTAAFLVPLIERTIAEPRRQTLILAPTRELAVQIDTELKKLSRGMRMYSVTCIGGTNIGPQIRALRQHNQFVIGTPGRILDLITRKHYVPRDVATVVLDEADRMLDMGFIHDMREILSTTPATKETLLFSATMSRETDSIVRDFLKNPVTVSVKKKDVTNTITQDVVRYAPAMKFQTLRDLLAGDTFQRVLIFGSMKHSVERLAQELTADGIPAESIHGNKNYSQRQRSLTRFKNGAARVLVATDVAARGIHIDNVTHVINYDLPNTFDDYVHRIGRTGRGSKRGIALTFVSK